MIQKIAVLGAGFIGASLAVGLAKQGFNVTVIERSQPQQGPESFGVDVRSVALSPASREYLESLEIWPEDFSEPYYALSIWEKHGVSNLNFDAAEMGLSNLGWIVEASKFQLKLWETLDDFGVNKRLDQPDSLAMNAKGIDVQFSDCSETFDLLIGADGSNSFVRQALSLPIKTTSKGQFALATIVRSQFDPEGIALQKFLDNGPVAALPSAKKNVRSIIWSQSESEINQKNQLSDSELCRQLEEVFGSRLGRIEEIGQRFVFPLMQQRVQSFMPDQKVIMIGDAARTIHPLAGFGANLGFEDAKGLLEVSRSGGLNDQEALNRYARRREIRSDYVIFLMESILKAYNDRSPIFNWLRSVAVGFIDEQAWIKNQIVKEASGLGPIARF